MGEVTTIGLDVAKSVFQIHGVDAAGTVVVRKRISPAKVLEFFSILPSCLVGLEACPSGHHWSRELRALGHTVRLMPPSYVKAYLKRSKNDANDAAAICEAVTRPSMRFVPIKSEQQQSGLILHRSRQLLVRQRTMLSNAIPRSLGRARHYLGEGTQRHIRAVQDHCRREGWSDPRGRTVQPRCSCSPTRRDRSRDRSYREAHPCLASFKRRKPPARADPRRWSHRRHRPGLRSR